MRAACALLLLLCLSHAASAAGYGDLGTLEKQAVDDALAARGFTLDPAPNGKVIGAVHVVTLEVFSDRDVGFRWLNLFHRTTRENIMRRESLLHPGDHYDPAIVDEMIRNLQNPSLSNVVVVLGVRSAEPGKVDLLIVTRDVWSLRLNTDFELQQGELIWFTGSLSENNLFGWRKHAAVVFDMDQGRMSIGPTYVDPNIAGTRLTFSTAARVFYERKIGTLDAGEMEGWSFSSALSYPFWSLARRWAAGASFGHAEGVVRSFVGSQLRQVGFFCAPPTEPTEQRCTVVPWMYRTRGSSANAYVERAFGHAVIQRVALGYELSVLRPSFVDEFPDDPMVRARFAASFFPRSERSSSLYARYYVFTPNFRVVRDLQTFDLRENVNLGPTFSITASRADSLIGAERDWSFVSTGAAWTLALGGGVQKASAGWSGRIERGRLVDRTATASLYAASPVLARAVRLIATAGGTVISDVTAPSYLSIGGESGLRGYTIGEFLGRGARAVTHLEARSMAFSVASLRVGGLLFHDAGHAADSVSALRLYHDVGAGLRMLIPQLNAYVLRADWAFPLQQAARTRPGWPGRITVGFHQIF